MDTHQRAIAEFDRAIAEHEARQLADELGYSFGVLTDGTIVLEPPAPAIDYSRNEGGAECARCDKTLDVFTRCQRVVMDVGLSFHLRFLCPNCYSIETAD
ncbi:hypothetical protein KDW75_gp49 [Mycobacterium phage Mercurio]|uniref:Uncharacterized protein n=1 Tax=Mycobacterium phage Mercurio TaxID=2575612 RepID=A0A5J6T8A3_9CAUD|nr:hypothetical protein KDW75_gp49 [Mycobacterium phage Mercurio]QFG06051.1 hypothetical protein PBI_MERCURIO_49 [Mycobacterium phage Mercurio]